MSLSIKQLLIIAVILFCFSVNISGAESTKVKKIKELEKAYIHFKIHDPKKCQLILDSLNSFSTQFLTAYELAFLQKTKGRIKYSESEYNEASELLQTALETIEHDSISNLKAQIYVLLGRTNSLLSNNAVAIAFLYDGLDIYRTLKNKKDEISILVTIAEYYRRIRKHDNALKYLNKANSIIDDEILQSEVGVRLCNRYAAVYDETGKTEKAIEYSLKALEQAKRINDLSLQATSLNELGFIYEKQGEIDLAESYYLQAESYYRLAGKARNQVTVLINLSRISEKMKHYRRALGYLDTLENIIDNKTWLNVRMEMYRHKTGIYEALGDYRNALQANKEFQDIRVGLLRKEIDIKALQVKAIYEAKEKDLIIENQTQQIEIDKKRIEEIKRNQTLTIVGVIVLILLSGILVSSYIIISNKNKQLKAINHKLKHSNSLLAKSVIEKKQLVREIHHRVKNNLNLLSGLIQVQKSNVADLAAKKTLEETLLRISVIALLHKLLQEDNASNPTVVAQEFFKSLIDNMIISLGLDKYSLECNISEDTVEIPLKKAIPLALLVNELLTNAYKHGNVNQEEFKISFDFSSHSNSVYLSVSENGPGLEDRSIINNPSTTGMKLITLFVRQLNARLSYSTNPLSKFTVTMSI